MKNITIAYCFVVLLAFVVPHSSEANMAPHWQANNIHCLDCHATHLGPKTDCTFCHNNSSGSGFSKTSAPAAQTHLSYTCETCHNPHASASAQCSAPLVEGTFSNYTVGASTTTFTIAPPVVHDPSWADPAKWHEKNGAERGLILLVQGGLWDTSRTVPAFVDYAAEVVGATATTITVQGVHAATNLTGATNFKLLYGQFINAKINDTAVNFTGPTTFADNDVQGGDLDSDGLLDDSTPDGVCQVCHTQSRYWRADGTRGEHFKGEDCMLCHEHVNGFSPTGAGGSCTGCHGFPPVVNTIGGPDGLVSYPYPTGVTNVGFHELHSATTEYNLGCGTCHFLGMPATALSGNDLIQMGFDAYGFSGSGSIYDGTATLAAPYDYEATNGTIVTTNGSLTCSNIYCHGDGTAVSTRFDDPAVYPGPNSTTPAWDGSSTDPDGDSCNNCHESLPSYPQDQPKSNSHARHQLMGYTCDQCHYATTTDNLTIADKSKHVNGSYDVDPGPTFFAGGLNRTLNFTYNFDAGGGSCASNTCHQYWGVADPTNWGGVTLEPQANFLPGRGCSEIVFQAVGPFCYPGCTEPFTYSWDFGDGTTGTGSPISHVFPATGSYTVTLTQRDANKHGGTWTTTVLIGSCPDDNNPCTDEVCNPANTYCEYTCNVQAPSDQCCTDVACSDTEICIAIDSDFDGLPDYWETLHGLNPFNASDAGWDPDGDDLTNLEEFQLNTDPNNADTDFDGISDTYDGFPLDGSQSVCPAVVQHYETGAPYASVYNAYHAPAFLDNNMIQITVSDHAENLLFDRNITTTLSGGYSCDFSSNPVNTAIQGSITITDGTVIIEHIAIR